MTARLVVSLGLFLTADVSATPWPTWLAQPQARHFRYVNTGSTGQCQYILSGRYAIPIQIDLTRSDSRALHAFDNLSAEVMVPNMMGDVVLVGYIDPKPILLNNGPTDDLSGNNRGVVAYPFVMKTWYLPSPFQKELPRPPLDDLRPVRYATKTKLIRRDFDYPNAAHGKLDWRAKDFHLEQFVRRMRLKPIPYERMIFLTKAAPTRVLTSAGWLP